MAASRYVHYPADHVEAFLGLVNDSACNLFIMYVVYVVDNTILKHVVHRLLAEWHTPDAILLSPAEIRLKTDLERSGPLRYREFLAHRRGSKRRPFSAAFSGAGSLLAFRDQRRFFASQSGTEWTTV